MTALASTTMLRSPGRRTTRSGRSRPSSPVVCSSKSQYGAMPASSTTRRSCTSPHRPRTPGLLSARASDAVSSRRRRSASCRPATRSVSAPWPVSTRRSPESMRSSDSRTGRNSSSIAVCRASRSPRAPWLNSPSCVRARSRNDRLFESRAWRDSASNVSRSRVSAASWTACRSTASRRSPSSSASSRTSASRASPSRVRARRPTISQVVRTPTTTPTPAPIPSATLSIPGSTPSMTGV